MLPGRDGTPSLSRKSKSTPPLTRVKGIVDLSQSIVIVCRVEIIENFFNFVLKFVFICPTRGKDGPRVFIILVIITTCYISNISRISLLVRLVSSDSVKVITGHIRLRTRVHSWTHVRILICPVITFIGHKPFPSLFWRNSFFTFFQLC